MKIFYKLLFAILLIHLTGCGFHLRGYEAVPPQLRHLTLKINDPYSPLAKQLQSSLSVAGITLSPTAPIILQILGDANSKQVTSQGVSGQLVTYLLSYSLTYQLLGADGRVIQSPQTVTATRNYIVSANQLLGDTNVQQNLQSDMRRDAISQLLQRLRRTP
jgi:LPS-assembly lipoprotein